MEKACETCRHYLGGGCCDLSLEQECRDGGFEEWEGVTALDGEGISVAPVLDRPAH